MGKVKLTKKQATIFAELAKDKFLSSQFYFTGGTALSVVYLNHRLSEDLDFFSEKEFDAQAVFDMVTQWARKFGFTFERRQIGNAQIYQFQYPDGETLKVDFAYYPHQRLEKGKALNGVSIDSLLDIATNKIVTIPNWS